MIKPKPIEINQLIHNVERMLRRIIGEHIEFRTDLHSDAGCIHADPNQIEAVLLNLATNAQDAMARGLLEIATANVARCSRAGRYTPRTACRLACPSYGPRHRSRHGRGNPAAHLRAVLYNEADG